MKKADDAVLTTLAERLRPVGMMTRGGFHPTASDDLPPLPDGTAPMTVILIGNAGAGMWRAFASAGVAGQNPLDDWTREVLNEVAAAVGAAALFPFDGPPWLPFQRWALRADNVHPSPIGPLIHSVYGLWHAYRGALAFAETVALTPKTGEPSPCDACVDKPCLAACPVEALSPGSYDVAACAAHVGGPKGAECMNAGCRARAACPIGVDYRYAPDQARFHMAAFLRRVSEGTSAVGKGGRDSG